MLNCLRSLVGSGGSCIACAVGIELEGEDLFALTNKSFFLFNDDDESIGFVESQVILIVGN